MTEPSNTPQEAPETKSVFIVHVNDEIKGFVDTFEEAEKIVEKIFNNVKREIKGETFRSESTENDYKLYELYSRGKYWIMAYETLECTAGIEKIERL